MKNASLHLAQPSTQPTYFELVVGAPLWSMIAHEAKTPAVDTKDCEYSDSNNGTGNKQFNRSIRNTAGKQSRGTKW